MLSPAVCVVAVVPLGRAGVPLRFAAVPVYDPPVTSNFTLPADGFEGVMVRPTLFAVDVKSHTPYLLNCTGLTYLPIGTKAIPGPNDNPATIAQYTSCSGSIAELRTDSGHSEWEDGNTSQAGFTMAWPPNKITPGRFSGTSVADTDLIAIREENGGPTFASRFRPARRTRRCRGDGLWTRNFLRFGR